MTDPHPNAAAAQPSPAATTAGAAPTRTGAPVLPLTLALLVALSACGGGSGTAAGTGGTANNGSTTDNGSAVTPTPSPAPAPAPTPGSSPVPGPAPTATAPVDFDSDAAMSARSALSQTAIKTAAASASGLCSGNTPFPAQVDWAASVAHQPAEPATGGEPLIRQVRNGVVIASYTSLGKAGCYQPENNDLAPDPACGVFSRGFGRNWQDGDVFEILPAIYEGEDQHPYIGPAVSTHAEYDAGGRTVPTRITLRGVTVDGKRPVLRMPADGPSYNTLGQGLVYIDESSAITIENLDIDAGSGSVSGGAKAGIYIRAGHNLTLRDVRVTGFSRFDMNGIFTAGDTSGLLRLDRLELANNGGGGGPEHNIYVNASEIDPAFTVWMTGSYSHHAVYGHTYKSRAQVNLLEGNYFQGTVPAAGTLAENYLIDLPEGGRSLIRNNLLVKNAAGPDSNGAMLTWAVEGIPDARPLSLVIEHNSFIAHALTFDGLHEIYPIFTRYAGAGGDQPGLNRVSVNNNLYAGLCADQGQQGFRGDAAWTVAFSDLNADFSPKDKAVSGNPAVVGRPAYVHRASSGPRQTSMRGAFD